MEINQFDIFWINLDPTIGAEIKKIRPAVVVSPNELNQFLHTVIVAPLTSTIRGSFSFRPQVQVEGKTGEVVLDQIRSIDKSRLKTKLGILTPQESQKILEILQEMFG